MKLEYLNSLEMIKEVDEDLKELVESFVSKFPEKLLKKMDKGNKKGFVIDDNKRWAYEENGNELSISVSHAINNKEFMNMLLVGIRETDMLAWPKHQGDTFIGYVTVYFHQKGSRKPATSLSYDFNARKAPYDVIISVSTNLNANYKEYNEKLTEAGLLDMHKRITNGYKHVDTPKILEKNKGTNSR